MDEPYIETERLILRTIDPERDFEGWASSMADEQTVRYIGGKTMDRPNAWRNMATVMGHWQIRGYGFFSVEEKATGAWVGRVGPWYPYDWPEPEVGWTIMREHWGKGFASEAGRAAIDYARDILGWSQVIHAIIEGNHGSAAVAEKLGSKKLREQQGLGGVTDELVWIYGQRFE
ncbi:MAG: GNAT family N-acetyltransferase [Pseudomonadota bacterium]